jgi:polysaccharide biosynthesis protein PslG
VRTRLVLLLGAFLTAALPGGAKVPGAEARVGLSSHLFWDSKGEVERELHRVSRGGIRWIREDFSWAQLEPRNDVFEWSRADTLMHGAEREGINVLAILDYSADWAASGPELTYPPGNPPEYAEYARAVVARYPGIKAVEIWNEPNGWWAWRPDPDPAAYARLARLAATAVKSVRPDIQVLICGDALQQRSDGSTPEWLRAVLTAEPSLREVVDGYSVHPYPSPRHLGPEADAAAPQLSFGRVATTHAIDSSRPIWITEIGWSTANAAPGGVSEERQGQHIQDALKRALGDWRTFVARTFVYSWDRSSGKAWDLEGNFGLRRQDGSSKPGWEALQNLVDSR